MKEGFVPGEGWVVGIDPGLTGAIAVTNGKELWVSLIPLLQEGKERRVDFGGICTQLNFIQEKWGYLPIFLERAVSFGMGTKGAFNYGRSFEALVIAIVEMEFSFTLVEPGKWAKEMHAGIATDIKAKAKSLVAVKRLYPKLWQSLPKRPKGGLMDGPIDALLIAGYGLRSLNGGARPGKPKTLFDQFKEDEPAGFL